MRQYWARLENKRLGLLTLAVCVVAEFLIWTNPLGSAGSSHRHHLAGSRAVRALFLALVEEASTTSSDAVGHVLTRSQCVGLSRRIQMVTATSSMLVYCTDDAY